MVVAWKALFLLFILFGGPFNHFEERVGKSHSIGLFENIGLSLG
jgi:hypothetical protein